MRAAKTAAFALASIVASTSLSAHRRDEYLQAARLAIEPGRIELQLDLTPGIAVADAIIKEVDPDRDGLLSANEKRTYVRTVSGAVDLRLDGQPLDVEPVTATFPDLEAFRRGEGTIRLRFDAAVPRLSSGDHRLFFRNTHRREASAYLANALVPSSDRITVTAQKRDADQCELTIDYVMRVQPASTRWLLFGGLAGMVLLLARIGHRSSKD